MAYSTEEDLKDNCALDYGLVSIVMPNFNGERFLKETIESVISQTYSKWELIIVDDHSTDSSNEIIKKYAAADKRIVHLINDINSGAAHSRNKAIRAAKGKWIAFLDSDDLWYPEKLEKQLKFMCDNGYHFSYTFYEQIDETSKPLNVVITGPKKIGKRKMYRYCYVGCLTVMYDCELTGIIQVDESLKSRNDYAIWLKVCKYAKCYLLKRCLAKYRLRSNSLSHSGLKKSLKNQYLLYRVGEGKNAFVSTFFVLRNVFFGVLKKVFYKKSKRV